MRRVKQFKKWGVYALSDKERSEFGFSFAVIHPDVMGTGMLSPADSDWECDTLEDAVSWIQNYDA